MSDTSRNEATAAPRPTDAVEINGIDFTFQDIHGVVDAFYRQVGVDPLLKIPFHTVDDWPHHIVKMTHFWWIRFGGKPYLPMTYNPALKHYLAGFNAEYLARWLGLFHATMDSRLSGPQAQLWGMMADRMGMALTAKNEMYKEMYGGAPPPAGED
jgi:hemoglobin